MKYGFSKTTDYGFEQAIEKVTEELKKMGFNASNLSGGMIRWNASGLK